MFNSIGNKRKLDFIISGNQSKSYSWNNKIINDLENSHLIPIEIKIEMLEIIAGYRFMTELIPTNTSHNSLDKLEEFLTRYNVPYFRNSFIPKKRKKKMIFYSLFTNEATKHFFISFEKEIESSELGLLYGYHPKSILAFIGLLESTSYENLQFPYQLFNKKVMSKQFFEEEDKYNLEKWNVISKLSPKIIEEANEYFKKYIQAK